MPKVTERFNEAGLDFELYSDGDCIITTPSSGYMQLSAELIARLTQKPSKPRNGAKHIPAGQVKVAKQDNPVLGKDAGAIKRRINPVSAPIPGWECVLVAQGQEDIRQVYLSRKYARAAQPDTLVGVNGRVA